MFNTKSFQVLNLKKPYIYMSHKCAEAIKHIVNIAPQEAQWFNVIDSITETTAGIEISLSDRLFIPEQICSVTEVNSDPNMMINFYRELSSEMSQDEVNRTLTNMTCWSHSHHTMGVSPSGQDQKQFLDFIKMNTHQNTSQSVLMLIFNKKSEVYSRFYDAKTGVISENLDIVVDDSSLYDFSYIAQAAKTKFKNPPLPKFTSAFGSSLLKKTSSSSKMTGLFDQSISDIIHSHNDSDSVDIPHSLILDALKVNTLPLVPCCKYFDGTTARHFLANMADNVLPVELFVFMNLLLGKHASLTYKKLNSNSIPDLDLNPKATVFIDFIKYLKTSEDSFEELVEALQQSLTIADLADSDEATFKMYMEN